LDRSEGLDNLFVADSVPAFGTKSDRNTLADFRAFMLDSQPQVVVFDPVYLAMGGVSIADMNEAGQVLQRISRICRDEYGAWPIFCHHAKKDQTREFQPMSLGDLSGAGISAFARQWLLLSHAEEYRDGVARLHATIGGSATGDRGRWVFTISEGVPDDILGRTWATSVERYSDDRGENGMTVLQALQYFSVPENSKSIAAYVGSTEKAILPQLRKLVESGQVQFIDKKYQLRIDE
jgi:hypothetical protein